MVPPAPRRRETSPRPAVRFPASLRFPPREPALDEVLPDCPLPWNESIAAAGGVKQPTLRRPVGRGRAPLCPSSAPSKEEGEQSADRRWCGSAAPRDPPSQAG